MQASKERLLGLFGLGSILVLLLLTVYTVIVLQNSSQDSRRWVEAAEQANRAYLDGDYNTAILLYEALLADGAKSGVIYYNLGTIYFQSEILDRAWLNLMRAKRYLPRDSDVSTVLVQIESALVNEGINQTTFSARGLVYDISGLMTRRELFTVGLVIWGGIFGVVALLILGMVSASLSKPLLIGLSLTFALLIPLISVRLYDDDVRPMAIVVDEDVQVYSGPSEEYLWLYELSLATPIRIVRRDEYWLHIRLADRREGWIASEHVELVSP